MHVEYQFSTIYLADLDAIQGCGEHTALLARITADFPALELWFDGGFRSASAISAIADKPRVRAVIGSESWIDSSLRPPAGTLLSIDSDADGPRDDSGICEDPARRPRDLILMNLTRVGSQRGPDLSLLSDWQNKAPAAHLYLAGGIRNAADLAAAEAAGAHGVLVASALHDGSLGRVIGKTSGITAGNHGK